MQINISGHHVEVTTALRQYTQEKLERLYNYIDNITNLHVILSVEKLRHRAKANVSIKGATLHAESESEDMYAAIDTLVDKLHRQAIKHKEKHQHHNKEDGDNIL